MEYDLESAVQGVIDTPEGPEVFQSSLEYWGMGEYEASWRRELARVLRGDDACLITSLPTPGSDECVFCWPVYVSSKAALLQNQIRFPQEAERVFDPLNPSAGMRQRETGGEDGTPVSEWEVPLSDIADFLRLSGATCNQVERID